MKYELIDIHAHVNFNAFRGDGPEVIGRAHDNDVGMILVGSQIDTSKRAVTYAERYGNGVWAAVGLHPIHLCEIDVDPEEIGQEGVPGFQTRVEEFSREAYETLASHPKVVAVGECGLDYFRTGDTDDKQELQKQVLREQIRLARAVKKPLIIHCRNAYEDLLPILREERAGDVGGTIHFFVGTWEEARKFLDIGFYLSFTGVITFARNYDEVVRNIPLDRIMVETDAPYVAPVPYRGKRNEPLYVKEIAKKVAELRDVPYEKIAEATTKNAMRLFKLE